jgi:hypothetical protein
MTVDAPTCRECGSMVLNAVCSHCDSVDFAAVLALRIEVKRLRADVNTFARREAERMAEAAIAAAVTPIRPPATSSLPAPGVLLLDNTTLYYAAGALEREEAMLDSWCEAGSEEVQVCREAAEHLRAVADASKAGAPNERGYPEITVRVQGVSAERDE